MPLTEKDVNFEYDTGSKIISNFGKFNVKALKYKVNSLGKPILYTKGHGKSTQTLNFESVLNMFRTSAEREAEEELKLKKEQIISEKMKAWRDYTKTILARATEAKKSMKLN